MNLLEEIGKEKIALLVFPQKDYLDYISKTIKSFDSDKIFYVTLNRGCHTLIEHFAKYKINLNNIFFIDCITKTIMDPLQIRRCVYLNSPESLDGITETIESSIYTNDVIFIDAPSILLVYYNPERVLKFIKTLSQIISSTPNKVLILTISNTKDGLRFIKLAKKIVKKMIYETK